MLNTTLELPHQSLVLPLDISRNASSLVPGHGLTLSSGKEDLTLMSTDFEIFLEFLTKYSRLQPGLACDSQSSETGGSIR